MENDMDTEGKRGRRIWRCRERKNEMEMERMGGENKIEMEMEMEKEGGMENEWR